MVQCVGEIILCSIYRGHTFNASTAAYGDFETNISLSCKIDRFRRLAWNLAHA